jgi:chromosome segregation ATPase
MDKLLEIKLGFNLESDSFIDAVSKRDLVLKEYLKDISQAKLAITDISEGIYKNYEKNLILVQEIEKTLADKKAELNLLNKSIEESKTKFNADIDSRKVDIEAYTKREQALMDKIETRLNEISNLEEQIVALRMAESSHTRDNVKLTAEEKRLSVSIEEKRILLEDMTNEEVRLKLSIHNLSEIKAKLK